VASKAKPLAALVFLAVVAVVVLAATASWALRPAAGVRDGGRIVLVPPHLGVREVARLLADDGLIRSSAAFVALAAVRGTARQLKAGEYSVPRNSSTLTVLSLLESGRVIQHPVLLPEGATVAELAQALETAGLAAASDVRRLSRDRAFLARLGVAAPSLEGYLFPDTYYFVRGMETDDILSRMVQRMRAKLTPEILARGTARGLGVHELLTLASIVEREAVVRDELRVIAAVFWNRLQRDMPLQADPTVQYAAGKERRALTRADLQVDDPYNTYRYAGLPPGPIASPGLAAIEATLDPAPVAYLYFVSMDDRRHFFSTTIDAHNAAVARYRRGSAIAERP
jgi:UPF0755 protein